MISVTSMLVFLWLVKWKINHGRTALAHDPTSASESMNICVARLVDVIESVAPHDVAVNI